MLLRSALVLSVFFLSGCGATFQMPAPIAYPGACPAEDAKCQRNQDAQTLMYIGEQEAAKTLMCMDTSLAPYIQSCGELPVLY